MRSILIAWLVGVFLPLGSQPVPVDRIEITSSWVGLTSSKGPFKFHTRITRRGKGYVGSNGSPVAPEKVQALWDSLQAPPLPALDAANLGITAKGLEDNAERMVEEYAKRWQIEPSRTQKEVLVRAVTDLKQAQGQLPALFTGNWTDDYPWVRLRLTVNGKHWNWESSSQYPFMVPWENKSSEGASKTFNADISRSVAALMPRRDINLGRVSGADLGTDIVHKLREKLHVEWDRAEVIDSMPGVLERLQGSFAVSEAKLTSGEWVDGEVLLKGACLQTLLHPPQASERFAISSLFPRLDGRVEGIEEMLGAATRYLALVRSVPWLEAHLALPLVDPDPEKLFPPARSEFLSRFRQRLVDRALLDPAYMKEMRLKKTGEMVRLCLVGDRSLTNLALEAFREDMRKLGKEDLAKKVEAQAGEVALVNVGWGGYGCYLLVLPDCHSILWRWKAKEMFGWRLEEFPREADGKVGWECTAVVISPDGKITSP